VTRSCATCGHAPRNHGRWWADEPYGICRVRYCDCQGFADQLGDCPHNPRLSEGDEIRCSRCGVTLYVIDD
jgi:hypothetical protein